MRFLDKIRASLKPSIPEGLSYEDLLEHFASTMSGLVEARLEEMQDWLEDTDTKLTELSNDYPVVASIDKFSIKFNAIVDAQVSLWIATDDKLRLRFNAYWDAYSQRLKSTDMIDELKRTLEALNTGLADHVSKANEYGRRWTARADEADMKIEDLKTRNTIKWFSTLTVANLKADYFRAFKEQKM